LFHLQRFDPRILYNPVELPEKDNSSQPPGCRVVFTGSLAIKKGVIPLVRAWGEVIRVLPNAQLHLYGRDGKSPAGGSMREYLLSQLPDSVLASIVFHGHVTSEILREALRSAAVGVFPSFSEAFGLAPMECMAQGRPTIYSLRAGPGPELITDGENGLLIDPAKEAEIARAIIQVVSDADLATRLGAAGRRRIQESFSIEAIVRQNLAFYHDCVNHYS
jgi:glycosyltransferase involved in cell wall biosynthesis